MIEQEIETRFNDHAAVASSLVGSKVRWFLRGTAVGLLLLASINAMSFFVRSTDWSSLIGPPKSNEASIGFPLVVWESGNQYGGLFADYPNLGLNTLVAALVGAVIGVMAAARKDSLNGLMSSIQNAPSSTSVVSDRSATSPVQFSLQGLMIMTTVVAICVAVVSKMAANPTTLIGIYVLGPIGLVALAMIPKHLTWQHRVVLLIPITFGLIAIAILVGLSLQMEFDKVLMGIFLCWTPQSALAAISLTAWIFITKSSAVCG